MYYYEYYDDYAIKYKININMLKLAEIRKTIIEKCSYITHECYNTTSIPTQLDKEHFKNFSKRRINVITNSKIVNSYSYEYVVEYDYYHHPKLISLIDSLFKGNTDVINYLNDIKYDKSEIILDNPKEIIKELKNENPKEFNSKFKIIMDYQNILLKIYEDEKLNKNKKEINSYVSRILNCITVEKSAVFHFKNDNKKSNLKKKNLTLQK